MGLADNLPALLTQLADWQVLLDIAIFALAIFFLSRTLQATGTWKIAIGLVLAAILAGMAGIIGLRGVEWIFSNLSQVALIALIIIFQPEIRKILERTTTLLGSPPTADQEGLAGLVEETLFELAGRKWGAIIVLPGQDPLQQWITEGVQVDALPSFPMLVSIFDPNSPGHDGAMLLEHGRISRIGVHLPLSTSAKLSDAYGTRHHASMGLSEKTDAVILTVSEERGRISIFHKGRMTVVKEKGELARSLQAHDASRTGPAAMATSMPTAGKKFWPMLLQIAASLAVAAIFWAVVIMGKTESREMIFTVPIHYTGLRKPLVLEENIPTEVKLHLEGSASLLSTMDLSQLRLQVDLAEVTEGEQVVALTEQNVVVSKRIKVLEISPSSLDIRVKSLHEASLPIKPQLIGKVLPGLTLGAVSVNPASVRVLMPREGKNFQAPQWLFTTPIYLQGIKEDATVYCKVIVPSGVQPSDRRWPDIEVRLTLQRQKR